MTTSKRKIKAKPFVRDLRKGMSDMELLEKYSLSESQLHNLLHKLVDTGAIDEMELFMRTSLSDSAIGRAFVGAQRATEKIGYSADTSPDVSLTEQVDTTSGVFRRMLAKLGKTGS